MRIVMVALCAMAVAAQDLPRVGTPMDGYWGIWYFNQKVETEYVYKYSGGLGTYCAKHIPMAVYAPEVNKTFFVYGGRKADENTLLEMVSFYDHATGTVPKPVMLIDKKTTDAHDNPVLSIDDQGHLWVFASAHGTGRPAYIFRSVEPYSIETFEQIHEFNYSYPQPWFIPGKGFLFLHTRYGQGRRLFWMTSPDGRTWDEGSMLAHIDEGHYQLSWPWKDNVGTAFNYHPKGKGLNFRTNLYYAETADMGTTWTTVDGTVLTTPLLDVQNPALIHDYEADGLLVYLKDINYDAQGRPIILHLTSKTWEPGPEGGPHEWRVARWTGEKWVFTIAAESDNNYDMGSIYIEEDGTWRIIAPLGDEPQAFNPGGEMMMIVSTDQGATWSKPTPLTAKSPYNHTYARRPLHANPGFYAYWADGHGRQPSESRLYFYDQRENAVYRLPEHVEGESAKPEKVELATE